MPEDKDGFEEISDDIGFTKEELDKVKEIQDQYFSIQNELGALSLSELNIKQSKDSLAIKLKEIKTDEQKFLDGITEKYGQGSLDPKTGEFTPNK